MAESPARNTGERANGWSLGPAESHSRLVALRARYRSRGIRTISRSPYLAVSFVLDLVDETVHRLGDAGKVAAKALTVESGGHRLVLLGVDVDDARHVADASVVVRAMDHRNELVVRDRKSVV